MRTEKRRWASGGDGFSESTPNRLCFAAVRNRDNQFRYMEHGRHGKRQGKFRHIFPALEPTLRNLLLPAHPVETDHLHALEVVEVCLGGIVECQVSVFTDAEKTELRISKLQPLHVLSAEQRDILGIAVDRAEIAHVHALSQLLAQVAAKRGWMVLIEADIFVQMKPLYMIPRQAGNRGQGLQHIEL